MPSTRVGRDERDRQGARRGRVRGAQRGARHLLRLRRERDGGARSGALRGRPVGIARDGRWVLARRRSAAWPSRRAGCPRSAAGRRCRWWATRPARAGRPRADGRAIGPALTEVDVVFPVLHGALRRGRHHPGAAGDERPALRRVRGLRQRRVDGQGVHQEAAGRRRAAAGRPRGPARRRGALSADPGVLDAADRERLGLPVFVKPSRAGSSIGITKVTDWAQFPDAVATAAAVDPKVVVEAAVAGAGDRVRRAGGRDGGPPEASLPAEIRLKPGYDWYDFDAKYLDDAVDFDVPADSRPSRRAWCRRPPGAPTSRWTATGLARVDFFLGTGADGRDGSGRQRGQHDAGVHADLDVPADVGGQRGVLPRAGGPAGRLARWRARAGRGTSGPPGDAGPPRAVLAGWRRSCPPPAARRPAPPGGGRGGSGHPGDGGGPRGAAARGGALRAAPDPRRRPRAVRRREDRRRRRHVLRRPARERAVLREYGYRHGWERFWGRRRAR
jgi:D-alanine-D-alanine ligase